MKKYLGLVISSAFLLAGCGSETTSSPASSGGSSSTSTSYYTFNFVELDAVGTLPSSSCKVYDYDDPTNPSEYIIGYPSNGEDLVITVHEADGSLALNDDSSVKQYTISDWGDSHSQFRIAQSDVPDGGYVSFMSNSTDNTLDEYAVLSIEKSLIPSSLSINASGKYGSCITGSNVTYVDLDATLYPAPGYHYFGFNTYNLDTSDLENYYSDTNQGAAPDYNGITFSSQNDKRIMGVRYASDSSGVLGDIEAFNFFSVANLSNDDQKSLTALDGQGYWYIPTDVDSLTKAEINLSYSTYGNYLWQPLSANADGTYGYSTATIDGDYYLWLEGSDAGWAFTVSTQLSSLDTDIDYSSEIGSLSLPLNQTIDNVTCSSDISEVGICIDSYDANGSEITMQRVSLTLDVSGLGDAQYVMYSTGNELPPVLEFGNSLDTLWNNSTAIYNVELSLVNADTSQFSSFAAEQENTTWLASGGTQPDFTDSITLLNSYLDRQEFDNKRKATSFIRLDYAQ